MPELPEVEVVRAGLEPHLSQRTVADVDVLHPRAVRKHEAGPADFAARLVGAEVSSVRRRGKYLWLELDSGEVLLGHLGMSGQLRIQRPGTADERHLRVRIRFADGGPELRFVDQRTFGGLSVAGVVSAQGTKLPEPVAHIAADPMDAAFDVGGVVRRLRTRRSEVKRALLDQTLVSGIGNIYADEALWRARVHWAHPTARISVAKAKAVLSASREVMAEALEAGGTSFDALYVNVNGQSGYFERSLDAYGRMGEPCRRCHGRIRRAEFANRSAYFCPRCQRLPR